MLAQIYGPGTTVHFSRRGAVIVSRLFVVRGTLEQNLSSPGALHTGLIITHNFNFNLSGAAGVRSSTKRKPTVLSKVKEVLERVIRVNL